MAPCVAVGVHEVNGGSVEFDYGIMPTIQAVLRPFVFLAYCVSMINCLSSYLYHLLDRISKEDADHQRTWTTRRAKES